MATPASQRAVGGSRTDPSAAAAAAAPTISYTAATAAATKVGGTTGFADAAERDAVVDLANNLRTRAAEVEADVTSLASIVVTMRAALVRAGLLTS